MPLFTRAESLSIMRLFGDAYKEGVRDAEWVHDYARCVEHIKKTTEAGVYGKATESDTENWRRWKHRLLLMSNSKNPNPRAVDLINRIHKWHLVEGCILPLAQDFYNQGLQDWNKHPVQLNLVTLKNAYYPKWTRNGLRSRSFKVMWVEMQTFAYDRSKQYSGDDVSTTTSLTPRKFENFCLQVWRGLIDCTEKKDILKNKH